jgi:hypothetical protein
LQLSTDTRRKDGPGLANASAVLVGWNRETGQLLAGLFRGKVT